MWNKRTQEPFTPKPAYTPPSSTDTIKEGSPLSTSPLKSTEAEAPRGAASIGKSVTIQGQILSREDL